MKQHKRPCGDCPWRRVSCPGWLGGDLSPEEWLQVANGEMPVPCHKADAKGHEEIQCAGLAIYRANVSKLPRDPEVLRLPSDRYNVFEGPAAFVKHHRSTGIVSSELGRRR